MNEPVAWIPKGMILAKPKDLTDCIPLYTHPVKEPAVCIGYWDYKTGAFHKVLTKLQQKRVDEGFLQPVYTAGMLRVKELTDEEIENIYKDFFGFKPTDKFAVDFARAILRKAQEK